MSASADVLQRPGPVAVAAQQINWPQSSITRPKDGWNPEAFGREQIRGLVRRLFLWEDKRPIRQVVFSAAEPQTAIAGICDQVGHALALETSSSVAIVSRQKAGEEKLALHPLYAGHVPIKSWSVQLATNLWCVPDGSPHDLVSGSDASRWVVFLDQLRNEFAYSVIYGPAAGASSEAALLGRLTDGIVLVLGAHTTRKATARKITEILRGAHSNILGTVLSERSFPVPEGIYRRL
jgi:hypothetical protein